MQRPRLSEKSLGNCREPDRLGNQFIRTPPRLSRLAVRALRRVAHAGGEKVLTHLPERAHRCDHLAFPAADAAEI